MALKAWASRDWTQALDDSMTVQRADDDQGAGAKPWWLYLTLRIPAPPVSGQQPGQTFLISQEQARSLVQYLLDSGMLELDHTSATVSIARE